MIFVSSLALHTVTDSVEAREEVLHTRTSISQLLVELRISSS